MRSTYKLGDPRVEVQLPDRLGSVSGTRWRQSSERCQSGEKVTIDRLREVLTLSRQYVSFLSISHWIRDVGGRKTPDPPHRPHSTGNSCNHKTNAASTASLAPGATRMMQSPRSVRGSGHRLQRQYDGATLTFRREAERVPGRRRERKTPRVCRWCGQTILLGTGSYRAD